MTGLKLNIFRAAGNEQIARFRAGGLWLDAWIGRCWLALIIAVLMPWSLLAAEATTNAELKLVVAALAPVLEKLEPKPEISYPSHSVTLMVAYRSQPFKIHGRSMTGEISTNAHDQVGPSFKGFVLQAHLQDKGEMNQAVTPQTLHEPYWRTDLDVTPIGGTQKQIYWALSYGSRMDTNVLWEIRQALTGMRNPANKP